MLTQYTLFSLYVIIKTRPCTQRTWINQKYRFQYRNISIRQKSDSKKESKTFRVNPRRHMTETLMIRRKTLYNQLIQDKPRAKKEIIPLSIFYFSLLFYKEVGLVYHFN